ncbi:MAG: sulfotransferase domain-containing protein [Beijerinckiaceae bacterium]
MTQRLQFFIAGVQKGGTTALDRFLRGHPSIQMAVHKEPHFFNQDETVNWAAPDYARLHRLYDWSDARPLARGEATPITLYWPRALERVRVYNPAARLIISLRHPSYRAFSHWRMESKRGDERLCFEEAIGPSGRERVRLAPRGAHPVFSYVERGFYAGQITRLLGLFPREQAYFFRTDGLWAQPEIVLNEIQDFLGLERRLRPERCYVTPIDASELGGIPGPARVKLAEVFRRDIQSTATLTGLDLSDWLAPSYEEPMNSQVARVIQTAGAGALSYRSKYKGSDRKG